VKRRVGATAANIDDYGREKRDGAADPCRRRVDRGRTSVHRRQSSAVTRRGSQVAVHRTGLPHLPRTGRGATHRRVGCWKCRRFRALCRDEKHKTATTSARAGCSVRDAYSVGSAVDRDRVGDPCFSRPRFTHGVRAVLAWELSAQASRPCRCRRAVCRGVGKQTQAVSVA
jgi:hypothetical protein